MNDAESTVIKLLRANELVYAYIVSLLYKLPIQGQIGFLLAMRAERFGERNIGHAILKSIGDKRKLALYISSCPVDDRAVEELYSQNGFQGLEAYSRQAEKDFSNKEIPSAVLNFVLGRQTERAASVAVEFAQSS